MSLNIALPAHREALAWAAVQIQRNSNFVRELLGPVPAYSTRTERQGLWKGREMAIRALFSPEQSAAIVRALLSPLDIGGLDVRALKSGLTVLRDHDTDRFLMVGYDVDMQRVPSFIRALLAATTREEVLTALREAGR